MTEEEKEKLNEYKQRQKEWRDISVTQLSNTNNILLTLSSGLLAFCFDKCKIAHVHIDYTKNIEWSVLMYCIAIILLGISMVYGIAVLFSRLYDFRISRHLAFTRQRYYKIHSKYLPEKDSNESKFIDRINALRKVLFCKLFFIGKEEIKQLSEAANINGKFDKLSKISHILGSASWIWIKFEVMYFLLSCLFYFAHQILIH